MGSTRIAVGVWLERRDFEYPFRWQDLWQWYGYWTANLAGYAPRRANIRELIALVIEALERQHSVCRAKTRTTG
jgi:hypothetical protein